MGDPSVEAEFTRTLQRLKRRGCNLLLVGGVSDGVLTAASRKLLGDASERRYRLVVLAGMARADGSRLPGDDAEGAARVVTHGTQPRGADDVAADLAKRHVDDDIGELGSAISETITAFGDEGDGLNPGELRVCLDSLDSLLSRYDGPVVRQFLGIVTGQIRGANGMGHVVLPYDYEHETVQEFAPLFDAVIEYRVDGGGQERWHFTRRDLQSPWLPV